MNVKDYKGDGRSLFKSSNMEPFFRQESLVKQDSCKKLFSNQLHS
jgi:hypothetical protein